MMMIDKDQDILEADLIITCERESVYQSIIETILKN